ncbi:DUF4345 domain-containing protein [Rubritalea tangerina]|uniref:DUF4345 domain-containing protein n=1 Tax=Rubritalea tangerina TaxID=430798 RepID=A0ABW4ZF52_9BACT
MNIRSILLIFASLTITVIALLYGISPTWFFETFLATEAAPSIDQTHILRAVTTLYLSLGGFWLWSAFSDKYRDAGVLVLGIFCGGLVIGRVISIIVDGMPSTILLVYTLMELSLVPVCVWVLRSKKF